MTIQRKYSLPSCILILEGLSDANAAPPIDGRSLVSMLVNAECHFPNSGQPPLTGGRDFLESLVKAVSAYAQEFLSHVPHREAHFEQELVQVQKAEKNRHRLTVRTNEAQTNSNSANAPVSVDLTTVQLFDLVEAIDQFLADNRTLPNLSLAVVPVSKRHGGSRQNMAKQAVPATIGLSSLAIAAIAFFLVPIPEVQPPKPAAQSSSSQSSSPSPAPAITDPTQLEALNKKLYEQINNAWTTRATLDRDLSYQVVVSPQGAIVGYKPTDATANEQIGRTPLRSLLTPPLTTPSPTPQPVAQYRVVFTKGGKLQITNWEAK